MKNKAVFLDRDGTIIIDKIYLNDPKEVEFLPGAIEALKALQDSGYLLLVATNQSGVARGIVSRENIEKIHSVIRDEVGKKEVEIAGFYFAPYSVESEHPMRKPSPGMLELAAKEHQIAFSQSWMVGDKMSDVEAGHRAGCKSVLIGKEDPKDSHFDPPEAHLKDLQEAKNFILGSSQNV